jgi:hypothetical protein
MTQANVVRKNVRCKNEGHATVDRMGLRGKNEVRATMGRKGLRGKIAGCASKREPT